MADAAVWLQLTPERMLDDIDTDSSVAWGLSRRTLSREYSVASYIARYDSRGFQSQADSTAYTRVRA